MHIKLQRRFMHEAGGSGSPSGCFLVGGVIRAPGQAVEAAARAPDGKL